MQKISLQEAVKDYRTSQATLYRLLADGKLTRYHRAHDKRTYLDRSELDKEFATTPASSGRQRPSTGLRPPVKP